MKHPWQISGIGRPIGTSKIRQLWIRRRGQHLILRFLAYSLKVDTPESCCNFFSQLKASTLISVEGCKASLWAPGKALTWSLNDKIPFKRLITCFRHYFALGKFRSLRIKSILVPRASWSSCSGPQEALGTRMNLKLSKLISSRPQRFRMWRHLSSLTGKFRALFQAASAHSDPESANWPG